MAEFIILICIASGLYVLFSIGVGTIARHRGLDALWRAWVPLVSLILLTAIADDICYNGSMTKYSKRIIWSIILFCCLPVSYGIQYTLGSNPQTIAMITIPLFLCSWIGALVYIITLYQSLYCIYKSYAPASAAIYTGISIFFPIIIPVLLFSIKDYTQKHQL